jgi:hypothetical protein
VLGPALFACAVCATADPTLTTPGAEQPFSGRLRLTVDARAGEVRVGEPGAAEVVLDDRRFELRMLYAPAEDLEISAAVPALERRITSVGAGRVDRTSLGDVELRIDQLAYKASDASGRRRFGIFGGLKLPTAPEEADASGATLPAELQPGCGSLVAEAGAYYLLGHGLWSFLAAASLYLPFIVRDAPHAGDSLRTTTHVQLQPLPWLASRVGFNVRLDSSGELATDVTDPSSGGFIGYVSSELVVSPASDVVLTLGAFSPAVQLLQGDHHETTVFALTASYDF